MFLEISMSHSATYEKQMHLADTVAKCDICFSLLVWGSIFTGDISDLHPSDVYITKDGQGNNTTLLLIWTFESHWKLNFMQIVHAVIVEYEILTSTSTWFTYIHCNYDMHVIGQTPSISRALKDIFRKCKLYSWYTQYI